ncbi:MAG: hypothetical protein KAJ75_09585, partial [Alphaproteobacteria bacterium]|nr:hypothetical protein [Alphaproteobacteria bacterium]
GTPEKTFEDGVDLLGFERIATSLPTYRINLEYKPCWVVQNGDGLAASVTTARRAFLSTDFRKVTAEDSSIQTVHPLAVEATIRTLLTTETNAQTEETRLLNMLKVSRDILRLIVPFSIENAGLKIGDIIEVKINRFGLSNGKSFVIIGVAPSEPRQNNITLEVWG